MLGWKHILKYLIYLKMFVLAANTPWEVSTALDLSSLVGGLGGILVALGYMLHKLADFCNSGRRVSAKLFVLTFVILSLLVALVWLCSKVFDAWSVKIKEHELAERETQWRVKYHAEINYQNRREIAAENLTSILSGSERQLERLKTQLESENRDHEPLFETEKMIRAEAEGLVDGLRANEMYCIKSQEMTGRSESAQTNALLAKSRSLLVEALYPELYNEENDEDKSGNEIGKIDAKMVYDRRKKAVEVINQLLPEFSTLRDEIIAKPQIIK